MAQRGFTLTEAVMVMVLLLILAVYAVPRLQAVDAARVNAACRAIAADIRYVQSLAIASQKNHRIVFTAGSNSQYTVEKYDGTWQTIPRPTRPGNFTVQLADDYPGVVIDSSYTIEFNPYGEPVNGVGLFTVSYGGAAPVRTIEILQYTGRVRIN